MILEMIIDEIVDQGLEKFLLNLNGVIDINVEKQKFLSKITIQYNINEVTPIIIYNYIKLYLKNDDLFLMNFDKGSKQNIKLLTYTVDDICCDHCYKVLIELLFNDDNIKSVNTDFEFSKPAFDIEFKIEYDGKNCSELSLINFIKQNK